MFTLEPAIAVVAARAPPIPIPFCRLLTSTVVDVFPPAVAVELEIVAVISRSMSLSITAIPTAAELEIPTPGASALIDESSDAETVMSPPAAIVELPMIQARLSTSI